MNTIMDKKTEEINGILEQMDAGFKVSLECVGKNNMDKDAWIIKGSSCNMVPTVYINGEMISQSAGELAEMLMDTYRNHACKIQTPEKMISKEHIMESVLPRIVSADNAERLARRGIIADPVEGMDLLMTYYVPVQEMCTEDKMATVQINRTIAEISDIDLDEMRAAAKSHMEETAEIIPLSVLISQMMGMEMPTVEGVPEVMVVTNKDRHYGAPAVLIDGVLEQLKQKIGDRFFLLPSSVHECLAVPAEDTCIGAEMVQMVRDVNRSEVAVEERLADTAYLYRDGAFVKLA